MPIIVEDGTFPEGANSYISETDFDTYCDDRAITPTEGADAEAALIRASVALDGAYRAKYSGYRTLGREQGLEWPRTAAYDYEGMLIGDDEVPQEVRDATCELALREMAQPGSVTPDLERGGWIQSVSAGSVSVTYGGSTNRTTYTIVDAIMSKLLGAVQPFYNARAARG